MSEVEEKLLAVQAELKVPKDQFNSFGKYKYRSCEDILEAAKPICIKHGLLLTLSDEVVNVGPFNYVRSEAWVYSGEESMSCSAMAREAIEKKGMDASQITGTASSYARKIALNGLFCLDDTKDSDAKVVKTGADYGKKPDKDGEHTIAGFSGSYEEILAEMKKAPEVVNGVSNVNGGNLLEIVEEQEEKGMTADRLVMMLERYFGGEK